MAPVSVEFRHCICPVCADEVKGRATECGLSVEGRSLRCDAGHTFDIAREGYVNLLPASGRKDAVHGDTRAMLQSRREFLAREHYRFLAHALSGRCREALAASPRAPGERAVLDAGCGEGYYLHQLQQALAHGMGSPPERGADEPFLYGMDLAREAARLAAKRSAQLRICVANTMVRLPYASGSITVLLNLFAPRNPQEFARVLDADGTAVVVIPAAGHLREIRELVPLLPIAADKESNVIEQLHEYFEPIDRQPVEAPLHLQPSDIRLLIAMTPNAWFVPERSLSSLDGLDALSTQARFIMLQFRLKRVRLGKFAPRQTGSMSSRSSH